MIKTMTFISLQRDTLSNQIHLYSWQISDEKGQHRTIKAQITFDAEQRISQYRAVNVREIPLVHALLQHRQGDVFAIDFTEFNKRHCYDHRALHQQRSQKGSNILFQPKSLDSEKIQVHGFI